jgi:golgi phosphoprotein 3
MSLRLYEEILLLELDDEKGTSRSDSLYAQAMGGAVVAELMLEGRIRLAPEKKHRVEVVDPSPVGDPLLDATLAEMAAAKKPKPGSEWVAKVAAKGHLKAEAAGRLVAAGVLAQEDAKILGIFPTTRYPARDPRPEREVRARLTRAVCTDTRDVDARTVVLVALADAGKLLPRVIEKPRLKERKERIKAITSGEAVRAVTQEAIDAVQAAVMVAVMVPAIAAAAASH